MAKRRSNDERRTGLTANRDKQRSEAVYTVQQRMAQVARERTQEVFTSLNHYLDVAWLKAAYARVKPDSAPGVDGQSWAEYGQDLEKNLQDLLSWILDVDVRKYFDMLDHGQLRSLLDLRVRDGVIRRLIGKWLHAGVLDRGQLS